MTLLACAAGLHCGPKAAVVVEVPFPNHIRAPLEAALARFADALERQDYEELAQLGHAELGVTFWTSHGQPGETAFRLGSGRDSGSFEDYGLDTRDCEVLAERIERGLVDYTFDGRPHRLPDEVSTLEAGWSTVYLDPGVMVGVVLRELNEHGMHEQAQALLSDWPSFAFQSTHLGGNLVILVHRDPDQYRVSHVLVQTH